MGGGYDFNFTKVRQRTILKDSLGTIDVCQKPREHALKKVHVLINERKTYNKGYFERRRRAYAKCAVQIFYYNVLTSASDIASWRVTDGDGRLALDVGCAQGYGVDLLRGIGYKSYGVDLSDITATIKSRRRLIIGDARKLPFKYQSFDLIIGIETLEHIFDCTLALKSMYNALRYDGILVLTMPTKNPLNMISDKVHKEDHVSLLSSTELHHALKRAGFSKVLVKMFSFLPMSRFPLFGRFFTMNVPKTIARRAMALAVR